MTNALVLNFASYGDGDVGTVMAQQARGYAREFG